MIEKVIETWEQFVSGALPDALESLLADDVVFYSPIVHTPQQGKVVTRLYLHAATQVLFGGADEAFRYTKKVLSGNVAVLEFETSLDGRFVNGVDIIEANSAGQISEFRVMIRPLQAVNAVHAAMGALLAAGLRPP